MLVAAAGTKSVTKFAMSIISQGDEACDMPFVHFDRDADAKPFGCIRAEFSKIWLYELFRT